MFFSKNKIQEPLKSQKKFKSKYENYTIGKNSYGVPEVYDWNEGSTLKIGSYCSISSNVKIYLGGHHRTDWISTYPFPAFFNSAKKIQDFGGTNGDVEIGSDVWICSNVIILSGVKIGDGAVIANGALVTKDVSDYEIVGGNPAKHIRYRFDQQTIKLLQSIAWWKWEEDEILKIVDIICSTNIEQLIEYSEQRKF
ncbi:MAG: CatB-related O-acetyltransferase [Campylobacterales bacterium]|nr:CatB-related O-acetyltransferase [Campylobacterales bacterium]